MVGLNEILGNELIKRQFCGAIDANNVSHAYLLVGEKGIGKEMLAEAVALELLCDQRAEEHHACGVCPACRKVLSGNHPDLIFVRHEKPDVLSVDEVRAQIIDIIDIRPYSAAYKVYIVPDADKMNVQAQNALLKTLEEPPAYAVILLLAGQEKNLLDTIRSRVMRIQLKPCTDSEVRGYLETHFPDAGEALPLAVAFSRGNLGRAIDILQSDEFLNWYHLIIRICRGIKRMDSVQILAEVRGLLAACPDREDALDLIRLWYRDLMMYKVTKDMNALLFRSERSALMELASVSSYEGIEAIFEDIETCRRRLSANVSPELAWELLLLNMKEK